MGFTGGEIVYLRHVQRDRLGLVCPQRVVEDRGDAVLLWVPAGTQGWHFNMPDGRGLAATPLPEWSSAQRVPVPYTIGHGILSLQMRERDYAIRWFYTAEGLFYRWYGNLEAPSVTWRDDALAGIDTVDWDLDVLIEPDRSWQWKDEDDFTARLKMPDAYWVGDEERVRRAGREVVGLVEAGVFPFDGTWCDFVPDPSWGPLPRELPTGWDRPITPRET